MTGVLGVGSGEQNVPKQCSAKLTQKAAKGQSCGKLLINQFVILHNVMHRTYIPCFFVVPGLTHQYL